MIKELNSDEFSQLAAMKVGEERKYAYSKTNLNNANRYAQELNRFGRISKTHTKHSVSTITKELGYLKIIRVK